MKREDWAGEARERRHGSCLPKGASGVGGGMVRGVWEGRDGLQLFREVMASKREENSK